MGDVLWWVYADLLRTEPFPSAADVFYLVSYPLFAAGLFLLVRGRTRGRDLGGLLDAMIIAAGLGLLSWTFLMRPIAADDSLDLTGQLVSLAYPLADVVLLAMLARLVTSPGARTAKLPAAHGGPARPAGRGRHLRRPERLLHVRGRRPRPPTRCGSSRTPRWGAAALHPSMRPISDSVTVDGTRFTFRRFLLLGTTTLIAPAVLAQEGLRQPHRDRLAWGQHRRPGAVPADPGQGLDARPAGPGPVGAAGRPRQHRRPDRDREPDLGPRLPLALAAAARSGAPVSVVILDLDRLQGLPNDRHGHQAGDRLLKEATSAWKSVLRTEDLLVRYGGEEFCVLMSGSPTDVAYEVVERLRAATPRGQTFSAGLAQWNGRTADDLLARADAALYQAKHSGARPGLRLPLPPPRRNGPRPGRGRSSARRRWRPVHLRRRPASASRPEASW